MSSVSQERLVQGRTASPGFAQGPLVRIDRTGLACRRSGTSGEEADALRAAVAATHGQIAALAERAGGDAADILEFQLALLDDDSLLDPVFADISGGVPAGQAWCDTLAEQIAGYQGAADEYMRARSADLIDLRDRVLDCLNGGSADAGGIPAGSVVCADDLPPSRFLEIDWSRGGGLALLNGSTTSHVAMLARARGVPMVVQLGPLPEAGPVVLLDAERATLALDPSPAQISEFASRRNAFGREHAAARDLLAGPPALFGDEAVRLMINIQGLDDLADPDAEHADGVGLMRTEFLFDDPAGLPDEETQYRIYAAVLQWAAGRPVTIRTVDAGGDKPIPGFTLGEEANPFLGVRGLRLCLRRPDVFSVQLRALARAATLGHLKVMFPMVTVPAEFEAARDLFATVVADLHRHGVPAELPDLGIMVEVPAAALTADSFPVSFFSIGSNDLTQYVTACDRANGALAGLSDPLNPAVLDLISRTIACGRRKGISVSLCGDMASDPKCTKALLQCGLREFSMGPPSLARLKQTMIGIGGVCDQGAPQRDRRDGTGRLDGAGGRPACP
jgi:phosphotransferase system enzyme I (PtsI)